MAVVGVSRGTGPHDNVIGYMLVYVDDVMIVGPTILVEKVFDIYLTLWDVKVTGIMVADGAESQYATQEMRFLGCSIKR